jgi:esterase/lipase
VWGYKEAAIAASFYAKHNPAIKTLILGSGVYDFELFHKKMSRSPQKEVADKLAAAEKDQFYEQRSIAWDLDGLPQQIFIYHGKQDQIVEEAQVSSFRNGIAAKEYKVKYYVLDDQKHDISQSRHSSVLADILKSLKQKDY